jgi:SAM-dependent methyltransferase
MSAHALSATLSLDISYAAPLASAHPSSDERSPGWLARKNGSRLAARERALIAGKIEGGRSLTLDAQRGTAAGRLACLRATAAGTIDVLISVGALAESPDVAMMLAEIKRVLAPGARLVFVEPVAAPIGTRLRRVQRSLGRVWRWLTGGTKAPRDLWNDLKAARFDRLAFQRVDVRGLARLPVPHLVGEAAVSASGIAVTSRHRFGTSALAMSQPAFAFFG